ncbi:peroxiredoxin [Porphyromonas circumdentaria]|uniref:thioredoxin-dependent peroxiredoxin n=1 Tax=Porphyromonas circumdentaria TaxID=29524 RepID=A0A1T4MBP4_9PORP|nr:peroxiredoxin [Porphyromonas circumdentaria]MBB6275826.1 peroxiredoxin Q/BCP [Porphyromonas circumdentaria]MDO4721669.1 peroxiredoxin [Porphyromonas circumdentaria]SJZ64372.1 peroxiredoxin Q/BCP [Porphyromonas circumdentaria]
MNVGDKVPEILGLDQEGNMLKSSDFLGSPWVLYFYPKDNTSGCTAEACSLRDNIELLAEKGCKIVGVSKDSARSHQKFIEEHKLPFPLIADVEHTLQEQMGVWVKKSMYGREYMGTERTTFIIDREGVIAFVFRGKEIKTKEHAAQILKAL